jgi:hypothetical protein
MGNIMISDDVKTLLRDCIDSFEQLEILLLLHRRRDDTWAPDSIEGELNLDADAAETALEDLCRWSLIEVRVEGGVRCYRYRPDTPGLEATIHALAKAYEEHRLEVIKLMNKNAIERVRTSAMRAFADAFVVGGGGKKKDG